MRRLLPPLGSAKMADEDDLASACLGMNRFHDIYQSHLNLQH